MNEGRKERWYVGNLSLSRGFIGGALFSLSLSPGKQRSGCGGRRFPQAGKDEVMRIWTGLFPRDCDNEKRTMKCLECGNRQDVKDVLPA